MFLCINVTHTHTHTHTHIYKGIYHKELIHAIMEVDKSKVHRVNWQRRDPGKLCFSSSPKAGEKNQCSSLKAVRQEGFSLTQGRVNLPVLVRPSAVWMRATNIRKGNLLYSIYQVFISSKNTLPSTPGIKRSRQLLASQVSPGKLTHTISYPRVTLDKTKIIMPKNPNI